MEKNVSIDNHTPLSGIYDMFPETVEYANAYVPFQVSATLFEPQEGFSKGTIFKELYQPHPTLKGGRE